MEMDTLRREAANFSIKHIQPGHVRNSSVKVHYVCRERFLELLISRQDMVRRPDRDGFQFLHNESTQQTFAVRESDLLPPIDVQTAFN